MITGTGTLRASKCKIHLKNNLVVQTLRLCVFNNKGLNKYCRARETYETILIINMYIPIKSLVILSESYSCSRTYFYDGIGSIWVNVNNVFIPLSFYPSFECNGHLRITGLHADKAIFYSIPTNWCVDHSTFIWFEYDLRRTSQWFCLLCVCKSQCCSW